MLRFKYSRLALVLAVLLPFASSGMLNRAWGGEAVHPDGYDVRRRVEADDGKGRERWDEDVTKSREVWSGKDLTNRPKPEFHDLAELETKIDKQQHDPKLDTKTTLSLKDMDRISSNKRADDVAKNLGFDDAHQLKREFQADSKSDIFVDKGKNVYLGNKSGDGEPEFIGKMKE